MYFYSWKKINEQFKNEIRIIEPCEWGLIKVTIDVKN